MILKHVNSNLVCIMHEGKKKDARKKREREEIGV
jgi:hypothetical protein